jgi:hypothetical protein
MPMMFVFSKRLRHGSYQELLEPVFPLVAPTADVGMVVLKTWEMAKATDSLLTVVLLFSVSSIVSQLSFIVEVRVSVISRVRGTSTATTEVAVWGNSMTETAI